MSPRKRPHASTGLKPELWTSLRLLIQEDSVQHWHYFHNRQFQKVLHFPTPQEAVILSTVHGVHCRAEFVPRSLHCALRVLRELCVNSFSGISCLVATFYIQQFGCRATQADGAALERQLLDRGYTQAEDPSTAAVVVLNTCTVTAAADAQARDAIRKLHTQNPHARVIVTGCYAQRAPEELASLPGVTWVVGNSHKPQIPNLITQIVPAVSTPATGYRAVTDRKTVIPSEARNPLFPPASLDAPFHSFVVAQHVAPGYVNTLDSVVPSCTAQILTGDIFTHPEFLSAPIQGGESHHTRPILKIQDGCNNRCSFCIIPYVRGKSRSLPPDTVICEIQKLTSEYPLDPANPKVGQPILAVHQHSRGLPVAQALMTVLPDLSRQASSAPQPYSFSAREIVLSGINLGTYGRDLNPRVEFIDLIRRILDETPVERLRISSIEPQDVTQDLIDLFASTDRIAQHFHMPLQSASDRILAAMHRWYRSEHYARRVQLIHDRLPNAALGADLIAGFPGETESDHASTLNFIDRHPFTYLHVFSYSPRPGTKAAQSPNQVPSHIIKRRARELRALANQKSAAFRRTQTGRTARVLTLHRDDRSINEQTGAVYTPALSSNYLRVKVPGIHPSNHWQDILITAEEGNYLVGETVSTLDEFSVPSALSPTSV
jgi:threonylcarbamoyladenosine tRNA methylthiotransferase MtaB